MKKKILSLIFAICLIVPCAFIFSACDDKPEPIMHTVTFVYDNGTENNTIEVEEGKFATKPTDPVKVGYDFAGWYVDDFKWNFELVAVMKDTTLTAHWTEIPTPTTHTVKFMVDGEQYGETQTIESGSKATCPATEPSKTGYTFDGWYFGDEKWSFNLIPVTQNVELTAHWIIKTFWVTFNYDNGLEDREVLYNYGEKLKEPQKPQRNTDVFLGWFNGETKWDFENDTISDNLELIAKWQNHRLNVMFDAMNGVKIPMVIVAYGSYVPKPANPTKTGYTFAGWWYGEYEWNFAYNTVTESLTLTAHWTAINYSITYELDGGTNNESNLPSYNADNNITFAEPSKTGYKFMGWFIDSEFKNQITSTEGYFENLKVYAKWKSAYSIIYYLNGGTNHPDNPTTFLEDEEIVLKDPTIDNDYLTFAGWFLDENCSHKIETIPTGTKTNLPLWAKWGEVYNIMNKGTEMEAITGLTTLGKTLTKLTIPRDVKVIDDYAFKSSYNLEEVVFYKDSAVLIETGAFKDCSRLNSVVLPNNTFGIKGDAFYNCIKLTSISIPSSVKEIGESAFSGCSSLTTITIPSSVWTICSFSFSGCTNLETVIFETNSELEKIKDNVFKSCAKLKNITLPSSLKTINSSAFEGCSALETISIPQNVESIGDYAFFDCSSLKSVTFAENCKLAGISRSTFAGCSALETITIPRSVEDIGNYAFNGCSKLASVDFETGSSLVNINQNAFSGCSDLTTITIPKSVTKIEEMAFKGCADLASITFEQDSTLTYIGINAFSGCSDLTSITIPKSVTKIDNNAFNGCYELETITFETGSALTYIGSKTFSGCSSLTSITIPSSVEMIGNYLFDEFNHNFESIVFDDTSTWYVTTSESDWTSKTNGTAIDVSNSEANVEIFISTYNTYYLYKINS